MRHNEMRLTMKSDAVHLLLVAGLASLPSLATSETHTQKPTSKSGVGGNTGQILARRVILAFNATSASASPTISKPAFYTSSEEGKMVGLVRFELTTSCTPCKRATRLRYSPN